MCSDRTVWTGVHMAHLQGLPHGGTGGGFCCLPCSKKGTTQLCAKKSDHLRAEPAGEDFMTPWTRPTGGEDFMTLWTFPTAGEDLMTLWTCPTGREDFMTLWTCPTGREDFMTLWTCAVDLDMSHLRPLVLMCFSLQHRRALDLNQEIRCPDSQKGGNMLQRAHCGLLLDQQ